MSGLGFSTFCMGVPRERGIWFQSGCFGGKSRDRLGLWVKNLTAVTRVNFASCTFVYSFTF